MFVKTLLDLSVLQTFYLLQVTLLIVVRHQVHHNTVISKLDSGGNIAKEPCINSD